MKLPSEFTERMRRILGEEYGAFEQSYLEVRRYGLRVNTKKISPEEFERIAPFHLTKIPWIPGGYYYTQEDAPARHPFYYAGLYYLQEPSAMTPASVLGAKPGERVLDLCAAPGGKATALGAALGGEGLLVANDISASRARALLKNIEVFGISNSFITNEVPGKLAGRFPGFFDRVLVDAPCSGEGMFRKDEDTIRAWYPEKPAECARIQRDIILQGADMLRPGGKLLYSTCTFAPEENEEVIRHLLTECPEMELLEIPWREGFSKGLGDMGRCVRLWPHKTGGEGHFLALLGKRQERGSSLKAEVMVNRSDWPEQTVQVRSSDWPEQTVQVRSSDRPGQNAQQKNPNFPRQYAVEAEVGETVSRLAVQEWGAEKCKTAGIYAQEEKSGNRKNERRNGKQKRRNTGRFGDMPQKGGADKEQRKILDDFLKEIRRDWKQECLEIRKGQAYYVSPLLPDVTGIPFLRNGLYLGEIKKDRFEPSQSLAMALDAESYPAVIDLPWKDERLDRYLKGETIEIREGESTSPGGWQLLCVNGYPLGWGKLVGGLLKNKYHSGWRKK